jgi:Flp pilus assembly protein TadD
VEVVGEEGMAEVGEEEFFGRREGLGHAALWLCTPGDAERMGAKGRSQRIALADFLFGRGEYRKAGKIFGSVAETDSPEDVRGLTGQADSLVKRGKHREAAKLYRRALELDPENARAMNNLAYALLQSGDGLMEALRLARGAAEREPANPAFLETVGSVHLALGDGETAAKYLELAWGRALRREASVQVAIMDQLIRAWLAAGRPEMAQQVAEARARAFPEFRFPKDMRKMFPSAEKLRKKSLEKP